MSVWPLYGVHFRASHVASLQWVLGQWPESMVAFTSLLPFPTQMLTLLRFLPVFSHFLPLRNLVFFPRGDPLPHPPPSPTSQNGPPEESKGWQQVWERRKGLFPLGPRVCFLLHGECSFHLFKYVIRQAWSVINRWWAQFIWGQEESLCWQAGSSSVF